MSPELIAPFDVKSKHSTHYWIGLLAFFAFTHGVFCTRAAIAQDDVGRGLVCEYSNAPPSATLTGDSVPLAIGVQQAGSQHTDEILSYSFDLDGGDNVLIEVVQEGLDFTVTVQFPDGTERLFNSPMRRDEDELVLLEDLQAGAYRILIQSEEFTNATGTHRIRLTAVEDAPEATLALWRLLTSGAEAVAAAREQGWSAARAAYASALDVAAASGSTRWRAYTSYAVAMIDYWETTDPSNAATLAGSAAELYAALNEPQLSANATHLRATALIEIAEETEDPQTVFNEALREFERAASIQSRFGMTYELAHTLNNVGLTYYYMGDWRNARESWQRSVPLFSNAGELSGELFPLGNLGLVDFEEGQLAAASDSFREVLRRRVDYRNLRHRVDVLSNLASVQRILGNFDNSLEAFSCAREMAEAIDYEWGYGWALAGIGETYFGMGEFDLAEGYLRDALPIEQSAGDARGETAVLRHLGNLEQLRGNFAAALTLHREALDKTASPPDRALAQLDVTRDLSALGRDNDAIALARDALAIAEETASRLLIADVRHALGRAYLEAGSARAAMAEFEAALAAYDLLGMGVEAARTLNGLASGARQLGELVRALDYGEAALQHVERIRGRVADPELRALYLGAQGEYFDLQIELLMALYSSAAETADAYLLAALSTSEQSRARLTLDLLQRGAIDIVDSDPELSRRRAELYERLAERRFQRDTLARSSSLGDDVEAALSPILSELADIENELNLLDTRARGALAAAETIDASRILTAGDMQTELDADSTLLQFHLGQRASYVWVVTNDAIISAELPSAGTIDDLARAVIEDLSSAQRGVAATAAATDRRERLADLVVEPVRRHLTTPRLLIAADGALQYVPFGALPLRGADGVRQPLLGRFEVVDVPSISAVAARRALASDDVPTREIAAFVDPVFEATDPRLTARTLMTANDESEPRANSMFDRLRSGLTLDRLPFTAREADAIAALLPDDEILIARGFAASREQVLATDLSNFRIVHFATHGVINDRYADLSALIFSQYDRDGRPQTGIVALPDIYRLQLNADLVVLSACGTALGREIRSEGLLGLTQGFMRAGAKSLVASLWPVSDRATAELMALFYRFMLSDGLRPAEALRRAQQQVAAQARWSDPYFWAAFTLIGEWR